MLWSDHGRPENCAEANWLEAESQLMENKSTYLAALPAAAS